MEEKSSFADNGTLLGVVITFVIGAVLGNALLVHLGLHTITISCVL